MRRFFIQCDTGEEVDSDTGDLVRFEDHAAEVSRLNNDLTAALLERDALKALLESQKRATTDATHCPRCGSLYVSRGGQDGFPMTLMCTHGHHWTDTREG